MLALKRSDTARIAELFPLEEFYCPPEEIIVSEKHLRDIEAMLRVSGELIRQDVLQHWMIARGAEETWRSVEQPE